MSIGLIFKLNQHGAKSTLQTQGKELDSLRPAQGCPQKSSPWDGLRSRDRRLLRITWACFAWVQVHGWSSLQRLGRSPIWPTVFTNWDGRLIPSVHKQSFYYGSLNAHHLWNPWTSSRTGGDKGARTERIQEGTSESCQSLGWWKAMHTFWYLCNWIVVIQTGPTMAGKILITGSLNKIHAALEVNARERNVQWRHSEAALLGNWVANAFTKGRKRLHETQAAIGLREDWKACLTCLVRRPLV